MITNRSYVIDTNLFVSQLLTANSVPALAIQKSFNQGVILFSEETLSELINVIMRPKFDKYVSHSDRREYIHSICSISRTIPVFQNLKLCRDPKDNKILDVAINGEADVIISGDQDLLVLKKIRNIPILSPVKFMSIL